jgi:beta-glucosidase
VTRVPEVRPELGSELDSKLDSGLDLETKVRLLTGAAAFNLWPEPRVGLAELRLSDGPTGVRGLKFFGGRVVALLPNATLLASAWSEDTAREVGVILAQEAMAQQIHVVLGPTINLHRSLLGGRLFEAYSEDPLLTGRLAAAYVRGLQSEGVAACLKHLVANESETDRNTVNSVVDEATLRELYLLPFEIAVDESDPWSMMAAYNDVNGVPATEQHHVINEIVKGEWGYEGVVMSDWFATKSAAPAANGGLDLVMPGPHGPWGDALVAAVRSGQVDEATVDDHLRRVLRLAERTGALGTPRSYPPDLPAPDSVERREALTRLAAGGITVLTNRERALPLERGQRVAVIGRHAIETIDMGGGSAQVNPPYQVSVAEGLRALLGDAVSITDGVEVRSRPVAAKAGFVSDPDTGEAGTRLTYYAADGSVIESRHNPAAAAVVGFDDDFAEPVARVSFRATIDVSGPAAIGVMGVGDWVLRAGAVADEEVSLRTSGSGFGEEVLAPPTHVRPVSLAGRQEVEATVSLLSGGSLAGAGLYALIARPGARDDDAAIAEAVDAARSAQVAVVVVGLTEEQETEAVDKSTLRLPGSQDAMVSAVAAVADRTVVVVNAATPLLMPWRDEVDAILWAGLPGQEGGHAIAAALLGDIEPTGRLVTTFPVADGATPAWSVTPVDGYLVYTERTFIGYRGHEADRAPAPAYWFGHGLGYATWDYTQAERVDGLESPGVRVRVTNTGERRSREVVQLYFRPAEPDEPIRLVGWADTTVDPGQSDVVAVTSDPRLWRSWDTENGSWTTLSGSGQLVVARGLGDIRAVIDL